jgi:uncharacterized protein (TIGR03437 family)
MWKALPLVLTAAAFAQAPCTVVSSATYEPGGAVAPDMIAAAFTSAISSATATYSVSIRDSAGSARPASVLAVAAGQINFLVPAGTAIGTATVTLSRDGQVVASGAVPVAAIAPGIYTANASGRGAPAGLLLKVDAAGNRSFSNLFLADSKGRFMANPFDPSVAGSQFYLVLFGTGWRGHRGGVSATIGSVALPVLGAAGQGQYLGLDQVNLGPVPASLSLGEVEVRLSFDGMAANPVTVAPAPPGAGAWGRRASLQVANSEMGVAEVNGKIYVIGGYPASRVTSAAVQVYDPVTNEWALAAPLPAPVNHLMPAAVAGKLYVIGGQSDDGNSSFVNTVYEYDPSTNSWRARAPLPLARGGGAAAVLDGRIYVAGGRPPRGADFAVYDPQADLWTTLPDLPTQRNHLAVVAASGKIYVIGGRFGAGFNSELTGVVEIYDPRTNTWSQGARMPRPRGGINAVEALGCVHVFGGEGNPGGPNSLFPDHDVYDPATDTWTSLDPMPIPVHGVTGLAFLNGLIYLPGGGTAQGGSSGGTQHQVYRPRLSCR